MVREREEISFLKSSSPAPWAAVRTMKPVPSPAREEAALLSLFLMFSSVIFLEIPM